MNNHEEDTEWNDILRKKGIIPEVTDTQIEDIMDQVYPIIPSHSKLS
jgi:predicted GNAT family acetyltransferase